MHKIEKKDVREVHKFFKNISQEKNILHINEFNAAKIYDHKKSYFRLSNFWLDD